MNSSPLISIIVPVYNALDSIERCIGSILSQSFGSFEILLVDDGSTDGSSILIDEISKRDSRIRVFHKDNGGVSSARNVGISLSRGQWITFMDSDDYAWDQWLSLFVGMLQDDILLYVQGYDYRHGKDIGYEHFGADYMGNVRDGIKSLAVKGAIGYVWCKLFNKAIIEKNNLSFNHDLYFGEDEVFVLEYMSAVGMMKSVSQGYYVYQMPDWGKKYNDSFQSNCLIYRHMKSLYGNDFNDKFLMEHLCFVANSFFLGFDNRYGGYVCRTKLFRSTIAEDLDYMPISHVTKLAIKIIKPSFILAAVFLIKSYLRSKR